MKKLSLLSALLIVISIPLLLPSCKDEDEGPQVPRTELYVIDIGNFDKGPWKIIRYNGEGGDPKTVIGSGLSWPQDIIFLEDRGEMLVSNFVTGLIQRYDIETFEKKANFATGIGSPTRMKIKDGLLYVVLWQGNGKVRRYQLDGTLVDEFTSIGVNNSIGLDWDADGNLYVSSYNNGADGFVRKFDPDGKDLGNFIDSNLNGPTNIWFNANGHLLVNDFVGGAIREFDADGSFVRNAVIGLSQIEGVDFMENGNVLIGNGGTGAIKMYTPELTFIKDIVPSKSGGLVRPNGIIVRNVK